jgi:hypothetical protein
MIRIHECSHFACHQEVSAQQQKSAYAHGMLVHVRLVHFAASGISSRQGLSFSSQYRQAGSKPFLRRLGKSPLFPHSQTFRFFAQGAFVLEPWTNAIKGKKLPAPSFDFMDML